MGSGCGCVLDVFALLFVRGFISLVCANETGLLCTQLCLLWSSSGPCFLAGWGLSVLGIGFLASAEPVLPVFYSVLRIFSFSFLPYFPSGQRGHRGHLYAGSNSETFWVLFILLHEQRSHVTQADLKLYVSWGWPSAPNPPSYTSQVLGSGVWGTPSFYSFVYPRQALPAELQPRPYNYFINKLFISKMFINIL